mgnify:CR=1 FL=1
MTTSATSTASEVPHPLLRLLDLGRQARHMATGSELQFLLVNRTYSLCPYLLGAYWISEEGVVAQLRVAVEREVAAVNGEVGADGGGAVRQVAGLNKQQQATLQSIRDQLWAVAMHAGRWLRSQGAAGWLVRLAPRIRTP